MFKNFSHFQIFKKKNLNLFSYFKVSQQCPYLYIFTCTVPWRGKKGGSWQCQHCDLFSISVVFQCCGEKKNQMAFPSFASTREVLYGAGYVFDVSDGGNIETGVTRRSSLGALLCTPRVRMRWW